MKSMKTVAVMGFATLLVATTAWAGGAACSGEKGAMAEGKACKVSESKSAQMTEAKGGHCDMGKGASASMAEGKGCTLGANQMVYSFAVPTAECDHCADGITKAAMAQAGIHCVHVDLKNRVAYIVADKKMDKNVLAKAMKDAGYKNSFRGDGKVARAEAAKFMTASAGKPDACCATKAKDKA